ncbi:hypothetical protein GCM10010206_76860 [Streptomyces cinerochromogenes]|nr:hypothetical protein GCM10010206_76860 [Streptomyces cinerochromogenes]
MCRFRMDGQTVPDALARTGLLSQIRVLANKLCSRAGMSAHRRVVRSGAGGQGAVCAALRACARGADICPGCAGGRRVMMGYRARPGRGRGGQA